MQIVRIINETCKRIEIKAGDYKITDAPEVGDLAKQFPSGRFENIYLQGYDPYISIDLRTFGISAYVSEDTAEQRGVIARIGDVVARGKKANRAWIYGTLTYVPLVVGIWEVLSNEYVIGFAMVALSLALTPFVVIRKMQNTVVIYSEARGITKSFFERKKDEITVALIGALVGGLIMYLVRMFLPT